MTVYELLEDETHYFIVTEILNGGELFERLIEVKNFTESKASYIIKQVLMALNYMHNLNLMHRDIKPENILLVSHEIDNLQVKLADFGFSTMFDPEKGLQLKLGTITYMAPEILLRKKYNEKVDIWSVGVITYLLLSGNYPFYAVSDEH